MRRSSSDATGVGVQSVCMNGYRHKQYRHKHYRHKHYRHNAARYREGKKLLVLRFKGKPFMHTDCTPTPVASLLERRMPGGKAEGRGL
eukprot:scaffold69330_cov61-Phaeocystis_antarctica.AAC.4